MIHTLGAIHYAETLVFMFLMTLNRGNLVYIQLSMELENRDCLLSSSLFDV